MRTIVAALLATVLIGCQGTYRDKGNFVPHPAEAVSNVEPRARTLASVIGIRNPDKELGIPLAVEVRVQVENQGKQPLTFDPSTLRLTSGGLQQFSRPITEPRGAVEIAPGQSSTVTAYFPFPEGLDDGDVDLNGLNLQWAVSQGANRLSQSATFTRRSDPDRYYDRRPHFGVGIGVGTVID